MVRVGIRRSNRHLVLWIALFLAICNAVVPPLLRMSAVVRGDPVVEVCTAFGIKGLGPASESGGSTPSSDGSECKFCLGSQAPCVPTYAALLATQAASGQEPVRPSADPFLGSLSRIFSGPRGPPAIA